MTTHRDAEGKWILGHTPDGAVPWKPGESGNPAGSLPHPKVEPISVKEGVQQILGDCTTGEGGETQTMGTNNKLATKHIRAIKALMENPTVKDAAKAAGISGDTMHAYLRKPEFLAELKERQDQVLSATVASLSELSGEAAKVLRELLEDEGPSDSVKLRAAVAVLDRAGMGEAADKAGDPKLAILLDKLVEAAT